MKLIRSSVSSIELVFVVSIVEMERDASVVEAVEILVEGIVVATGIVIDDSDVTLAVTD